ncbi:hypothetical protein WG936_05550 [Corynebacterium sp. H127]|uniref:hypothetical protein n=1 Tax=Corynebacterium sp. H127 TaxID=3133418 RepID=UPI0030A0FB77
MNAACERVKDQIVMEWVIRWLLIIGVFRLLGFASDYLTGDIFTIGVVEVGSEIPQIVWGVACLVSALTIIVGMLVGRLRLQALGCLLAGATNAGFAAVTTSKAFLWIPLSQSQGILEKPAHWWARNVADWYCVVPVDDWRFPASYASLAAQWAVLCVALILIDAVLTARKRGGNGDD